MKTEFLLQRGSNSFLSLDLFTETVETELSQVNDQKKYLLSDSAIRGCSYFPSYRPLYTVIGIHKLYGCHPG